MTRASIVLALISTLYFLATSAEGGLRLPFVDAAIQRFMHEVDALVQEGLVTLEAVKIVSYGERSGE